MRHEVATLLGDIYETARSSIGVPVTLESSAVAMFRMVIAEGRILIRQRDKIEHHAEELLGRHPDATVSAKCPASDRSSP
jgi:hypothetical protein